MTIAIDRALALRPTPITLARRAGADTSVEGAIRRRELTLVERGVYAERGEWSALPPWDRYLTRVHAVALTHERAVFAAESAAALYGIPVLGSEPHVHLLVEDPGLARAGGTIRWHATQDGRDVREDGGVSVLSPAETAVDIARLRHPAIALMAADGALRVDPALTAPSLPGLNESRSSSRGRARARWALARATDQAETAIESLSRAAIEWLGFPEPALQQPFVGADGESARGDFFWDVERARLRARRGIFGEADGRVKYDGTFGDGAAALVAEKRREDAQRRQASGLARWMWPEVSEPARLGAVLRAAGLREIRPPDTGALESLRAALHARRPARP
ncbi:hypothetical protein [Microbacterium marinilacus]|uniref:Transcriptional regulator, AbiEi antitoxin, Type IV TA system n=1 Tax=Microbacterium marinilacus TaxID=415209 RepID=A0ABP7BDY1_9MICO